MSFQYLAGAVIWLPHFVSLIFHIHFIASVIDPKESSF